MTEMGSAGPGEVRVRVKSASHRCEDMEISVPLTHNVRQVKQLIKEQYPLHPEIEEQRIIYAGHLLEDKQILNQVFLPSGQMSSTGGYTLHLACNSTFLRKASKAFNESEEKKEVPSQGLGATNPTQQNSPPPNATGIPQDILAMHQMYVEQMMHFMSQWQWSQGYGMPQGYGMTQGYGIPQQGTWIPAQAPGGTQIPVPGVNMNVNMHPAGPHPQVPLNMNQPPQAPAPIVREPPVRNPAGEDEPARDVLDWMYTFSRAALILSVVYFYSNFTRFLLVLIFTSLVMLVQRRPDLLNGLRPNNNNAPARPAADAPGVQRQENNGDPIVDGPVRDPAANANRRDEEGAEAVSNSEGAEPSPAEEGLLPEAQPPQEPRYNPLDVTRTFLMTFFTSLIPEMQQN